MDERVLEDYRDAPSGSKVIIKEISNVQDKISKDLGYDRKGFKFKLIYNIIKVISMSQKIISQENTIKNLLRQKEEERLQKEEERRQKEEAKRIADLFRKQLVKMGFDPDTIQ